MAASPVVQATESAKTRRASASRPEYFLWCGHLQKYQEYTIKAAHPLAFILQAVNA